MRCLFYLFALTLAFNVQGQSFKELVGDVPVGEVNDKGQLNIPYITWGADVAEFYANWVRS